MYISHWGLVYLLPALFPEMAYLPMAGAYVVLSFVVANILIAICDKVISPAINRKPFPVPAK